MLDKKAWPKISSKINLSVNNVKAATTFMNALKNIRWNNEFYYIIIIIVLLVGEIMI